MIELGYDFERRINDMLRNTIAANSIKPITLGGVDGPDGGTGVPIGGFIGKLAQSLVTYDTTEAAIDTPSPLPSGVSLVTNLNKIRYDISEIDSRVIVLEGATPTVTFLALTDTPSIYSGEGGKFVKVNLAENALEFSSLPSGEGASSFIDLTDTPSSYESQAGKVVVVNETENGLGFVTLSGGSSTDTDAIHTTISGELYSLTEKTTPVDNDIVVIEDSENGYQKRRVRFGNFPTGSGVTASGIVGAQYVLWGQAITETAWSSLSWEDVDFDPQSTYNAGDPTKFYPPEDGVYFVTLMFNARGPYATFSGVHAYLMRVDPEEWYDYYIQIVTPSLPFHTATTNKYCNVSSAAIIPMTTNDYIYVDISSQGGTATIDTALMGAVKIAPLPAEHQYGFM